MQRVKLYTSRYVTQLHTDGTETRLIEPSGYVVDVEIPVFVAQPEVIRWGERTFVFHSRHKDGHHVYVEAFTWAVLAGFVNEGTAETPA